MDHHASIFDLSTSRSGPKTRLRYANQPEAPRPTSSSRLEKTGTESTALATAEMATRTTRAVAPSATTAGFSSEASQAEETWEAASAASEVTSSAVGSLISSS